MSIPLAVRHLAGKGWQVLLSSPERWQACETEQDARLIANGQLLAFSVMSGGEAGDDIAQKLDAAAQAVVRNIGVCTAARAFERAARIARGEESH